MCKIKTKHYESSFTSVFVVVKTLSSVVIVAGVAIYPLPSSNQYLPKNDIFSLKNHSPSFSEYNVHHVPLDKESKVDNFEQVIHDFYSELLAHQEPLGEKFEAVLFNNLWDLYED